MQETRKFVGAVDRRHEVAVVVGTRPGIIMLAPVIHELRRRGLPHFVIHTGQHYSPEMDAELFEDLDLPAPAFRLDGVAERPTHGGQTARMLEGCEAALLQRPPKLVLVNGDANTNLAAALAARKLRLGIGHIEAGERSFDWRMPEEHNRRIMDHISELLFATNEKAAARLRREDVPGEIHITGNTIVDASLQHGRLAAERSQALADRDLEAGRFALMTAHREENVDDPDKLRAIVEGAAALGESLGRPVAFVVHPRTRKRLREFGLEARAETAPALRLQDALRYLDFMQLLTHAEVVLTDSGGVQQEAYIHRRPCVTLRDGTEWTETLDNGGNRLAGADDPARIVAAAREALDRRPDAWPDIFGDGQAARRIVDVAAIFLGDAPS